MKDFIKAFLSFGLATSIEKLVGFILMPFYTKHFSVIEYGVIDMLQTVTTVATIFGILQLETSLQRLYYDFKKIKKKLFITNVFILVSIISFTITLILFFASGIITELIFGNQQLQTAVKLSVIQIPFINLGILGLVILRYERENLKFLWMIITKVVIILISVYLLVFYFKLGITGAVLSNLIAGMLSTTLIIFSIRNIFVFKMNYILIKKALIYAIPQFPARIGSITLSHGNRFFMLAFLSISSIGIFSVSLKWASSIQLLYTAFYMAWGPFIFSQFKRPDHTKTISLALPIVSSLLFPFIIIISLFSSELFLLMSPKEYFHGHKYLGSLSLYFGLFIIKEIVDIGPKFKEKTIFLTINFFVTVLVNCLLMFVLVPKFELMGVTFSLLITNLALVAISWFTSNKLYYIPFNVYLFILLLVPTLLICISSAFFLFDFITRLSVCVIFVTLYLTFAYYLFRKSKKTLINI